MRVRLSYPLLFFCLIAIDAHDADFTLPADGFAVIQTSTLAPGKICRKLDRSESHVPRAWFTKDVEQTIHLIADTPEKSAEWSNSEEKTKGCQKRIARKTLVGPLKRGRWKVFGTTETAKIHTVAYSLAKEIRAENGSYSFRLEEPAILTASMHYYRNVHGGCYEYLPLVFVTDKEKSTTELQVLEARAVERQRLTITHGLCRALLQTIAHGAQELPPGNYRFTGREIKRATLYFAE